MGYFDYSREPKSDIAFVDMKSFYASVECVKRGLHPLKTSLCVMSRADNSTGLILASSPLFKKIFGKSNVGRAYDLPFDIKTRKFSYYNARKQGLPTDSDYVRYIEDWAQVTLIVPPRMDEYIAVNMEIQRIFQNYGSPDDIYPYSIDEGFIDLLVRSTISSQLRVSLAKTSWICFLPVFRGIFGGRQGFTLQ